MAESKSKPRISPDGFRSPQPTSFARLNQPATYPNELSPSDQNLEQDTDMSVSQSSAIISDFWGQTIPSGSATEALLVVYLRALVSGSTDLDPSLIATLKNYQPSFLTHLVSPTKQEIQEKDASSSKPSSTSTSSSSILLPSHPHTLSPHCVPTLADALLLSRARSRPSTFTSKPLSPTSATGSNLTSTSRRGRVPSASPVGSPQTTHPSVTPTSSPPPLPPSSSTPSTSSPALASIQSISSLRTPIQNSRRSKPISSTSSHHTTASTASTTTTNNNSPNVILTQSSSHSNVPPSNTASHSAVSSSSSSSSSSTSSSTLSAPPVDNTSVLHRPQHTPTSIITKVHDHISSRTQSLSLDAIITDMTSLHPLPGRPLSSPTTLHSTGLDSEQPLLDLLPPPPLPPLRTVLPQPSSLPSLLRINQWQTPLGLSLLQNLLYVSAAEIVSLYEHSIRQSLKKLSIERNTETSTMSGIDTTVWEAGLTLPQDNRADVDTSTLSESGFQSRSLVESNSLPSSMLAKLLDAKQSALAHEASRQGDDDRRCGSRGFVKAADGRRVFGVLARTGQNTIQSSTSSLLSAPSSRSSLSLQPWSPHRSSISSSIPPNSLPSGPPSSYTFALSQSQSHPSSLIVPSATDPLTILEVIESTILPDDSSPLLPPLLYSNLLCSTQSWPGAPSPSVGFGIDVHFPRQDKPLHISLFALPPHPLPYPLGTSKDMPTDISNGSLPFVAHRGQLVDARATAFFHSLSTSSRVRLAATSPSLVRSLAPWLDPSSPQLLTKLHHLTSNRNVRRPSLSLSPSASSFISTATSSMPSRPSLSSSSSLRPPLIPSPSSPSLRKLTDELSTVLHPLPPSPSSSSIERTSQLTSPPPDPSFCLFLPDRHDGRVRGLALPPPPRSELLPAYLSFILPPSRMRACFPSTTTFSTSSLPDSEDPTLYHDPLVSSIDDVRDTATFLTQQNEDSSVDNPLPSPSSPLDCSREVVSSSPALCLSTSLLKPSALPRSRSSAVETLFPLCKDPQACRTWPELTEHQKQRQMIRSSGASLLLAAFDGDEDSVIRLVTAGHPINEFIQYPPAPSSPHRRWDTRTPSDWAALNGHFAIAHYLLSQGGLIGDVAASYLGVPPNKHVQSVRPTYQPPLGRSASGLIFASPSSSTMLAAKWITASAEKAVQAYKKASNVSSQPLILPSWHHIAVNSSFPPPLLTKALPKSSATPSSIPYSPNNDPTQTSLVVSPSVPSSHSSAPSLPSPRDVRVAIAIHSMTTEQTASDRHRNPSSLRDASRRTMIMLDKRISTKDALAMSNKAAAAARRQPRLPERIAMLLCRLDANITLSASELVELEKHFGLDLVGGGVTDDEGDNHRSGTKRKSAVVVRRRRFGLGGGGLGNSPTFPGLERRLAAIRQALARAAAEDDEDDTTTTTNHTASSENTRRKSIDVGGVDFDLLDLQRKWK